MRATKVGIREFRSGLAEYIASANPVAVTRHGQTVGYFIPTHVHTDADMAAAQRAPKLEKRTTFEKLNRFVFKRNAPGSADGKPVVTPAAGGSNPPPSQDTYTKYKVDWTKGSVTPE